MISNSRRKMFTVERHSWLDHLWSDEMRSLLLKAPNLPYIQFSVISPPKTGKKKFSPAILCPCSEQDFSLWREQKKRSEACLAEEALEGAGNCHLYLQPSQTPRGLLSRWPLPKLSEALTPFSQLRVSIDTGWLWFRHIKVVSHVLLTVKMGWVDAGTWIPCGIKHYYTSETLL